jgi:hypothetical protein
MIGRLVCEGRLFLSMTIEYEECIFSLSIEDKEQSSRR